MFKYLVQYEAKNTGLQVKAFKTLLEARKEVAGIIRAERQDNSGKAVFNWDKDKDSGVWWCGHYDINIQLIELTGNWQ